MNEPARAAAGPPTPAAPDDPHWLPPKPRRDIGLIIAGTAVALAIILGGIFTLVGATGVLDDDDGDVVTIGTTEGTQDYWPIFVRKAAERGVTIKTVNFADGNQANPALAQGQTDLNLFQHLQFLADYNVSTGADLRPVGSTYISPLAVYSKRYTSVQQIPAGGQVAIPNDPTNQARALLTLQSAGLISLRGGGTIVSTPADVLGSSRVKVVPVAAQQAATALGSVDAAVINNNFAADAGLDPKSAIYQDDPRSKAAEPYINIIAARRGSETDPRYLDVLAAWHDPEVTEAVVKASKGTTVIVDVPQDDLNRILDRLEGEISG